MEVPSFVSVIPPSTLPFSPMQLFRGRTGVGDAIQAGHGLSTGQCTLLAGQSVAHTTSTMVCESGQIRRSVNKVKIAAVYLLRTPE